VRPGEFFNRRSLGGGSKSSSEADAAVAPAIDFPGAHRARQGFASPLRALDPPGALPGIGNCRSDAEWIPPSWDRLLAGRALPG
jgi:hypothetical protein